jgi:hypothetical protein
MFLIQIDDKRLLGDFANFLEYKLPGVVTRGDDHVAVTLHGTLSDQAQERVLRRLLWAWRVERKAHLSVPARLRRLRATHV